MSWPLSQDYNEAIQSPATNFTDADLKKGEVVTNALGLPIPFSGNFADVYQVRCRDGSRWAVKCFTREAHGLRERYQEISAWLRRAKLPFTVDFSYLEQGIRIAGIWYPILKMQWVEGLTLNQFVAQYLDKPAMLEALLQLWAKMGKYLRAAQVGHCDLQHGNVLLVPGSTPNALALKLIDYDGMWIPPLAKSISGEVGHANYQHPRRLRDATYSLEVDRFPLLLVATAMRALKADKGLWAKYDNGDNLLFKESDLAAPGQSALFEELASLPDAGLVMLAAQVRAALKGPLESAALLEDAMPDVRPAPSVTPTRPSRLAPPSAGVTTQKTSPAASAIAVAAGESALDFDPAVRKPGASFVKKGPVNKVEPVAIPMAAWIGGAAALVVVATAVGGVTLWAMSGKRPTTETHMVQNNVASPSTQEANPAPTETPAIKADPVDAPPADNPPDDPPVVAPPVVVTKLDEPAADKPGVRVVRTYEWRYAGGVRSVGFSQNGATALALGADGVLTIFNPKSPGTASSATLSYHAKSAALTPDGRRAVIAGGDNKIHVRDLEEGKDMDFLLGSAGPLNWVDVAPDGKTAILAGDDGNLYLWDLPRAAVKKMWPGLEKAISQVRFSMDGKKAVSCGEDGIAHVWDLADARETFKIDKYLPNHPAQAATAVMLPGDKILVGYTNAARAIWDMKTGRMVGVNGTGPEANRAAAASADGRLTTTASDSRANFSILDQQGQHAYEVLMPPVAPGCLAFAPDSRHLLVGCMDGTLHYVSITLPGEETAVVVKAPDQPLPGLPFDVGWDKPVNPDGDCKFVVEKNALTIEAPNKDHDLGADRGVMNAPRLLREVEGDFTAQLRVSGEFQPVGPSTAAGRWPFVAAGLVLMVDDRNYLRLEHAVGLFSGPDNATSYVNWERRMDGKLVPIINTNVMIPRDKPIYLRLQRKGGQLLAFYGQDGEKWIPLPSIILPLPSTVKAGLSAGSNSSAPFKPHFDAFQLTADKTAVAVKPVPAPAPAVKDLRKPPMGDDLAKARDAVKQEYKADYDKLNTPKDKTDLANKLRAAAFTSKDNSDRQYALLIEARDLAARGEDLAASQKIITETAAAFVIDAKEAKEAALLAVGSTFSNKAAAKAYLAEVGPLLQEAKADDDYEHAAPFLPAVRKAATDAKDAEMTRTADSLVKLQKDYEAVKKDVQTLKDKPDDAEANLAVGKFYCFQKQDYDKGDPYLVKAGNLALATAATKDVDAPTDVAEQVALGDAWMKVGDNASLGIRLGAQRRAYDWYSKALPNLSEKEEARIKTKVAELTKQFPEVLSAWEDLDVTKAEAVGNAYVRLKPGQSISTRTALEGAVEIVLVARTAKAPPTFEFLMARQPFLAWQVGLAGVRGSRVPKRNGMGTFGGTNFQFTPNVWVTYTCKLQDMRMEGFVDGKPYFIDTINKNDLSKSRTVQVMAADQVLEVQSFKVNPIEKP